MLMISNNWGQIYPQMVNKVLARHAHAEKNMPS